MVIARSFYTYKAYVLFCLTTVPKFETLSEKKKMMEATESTANLKEILRVVSENFKQHDFMSSISWFFFGANYAQWNKINN